MEEAGGTPEPRRDESPGTIGRGMLVVGIVALVALVGMVAWVSRGDDVVETVDRAEERFPPEATAPAESTVVLTVPVTAAPATLPVTAVPPPPTEPPLTEPPPTEPPPTEPPPTEPPQTTIPPQPTAPVPVGPSIDEVVPSVAAFAERLATPAAVRAQIALLLGRPRHDVASPNGVAALCAIVTLDGPLAAQGRWERDGRQVSTSDLASHNPPGFGDCVGNGGDLLEDGSYQYIAADAEGDESAAGGFVVGAARVDQPFTNDGDEPVCGVRIAPRTSRYFEAYVFDDQPIAPGGGVTLPVAAVDQDIEVTSCGDGEVLASFDFEPDPSQPQALRP